MCISCGFFNLNENNLMVQESIPVFSKAVSVHPEFNEFGNFNITKCTIINMCSLRNIDLICANKNTSMLIECFSKIESW